MDARVKPAHDAESVGRLTAFAGMSGELGTALPHTPLIPAQAGIQSYGTEFVALDPRFAGMSGDWNGQFPTANAFSTPIVRHPTKCAAEPCSAALFFARKVRHSNGNKKQ